MFILQQQSVSEHKTFHGDFLSTYLVFDVKTKIMQKDIALQVISISSKRYKK